MLIHKITSGYVVQMFDTKLGKFIDQQFVAGDECSYEDEDGDSVDSNLLEVDGKEVYLPFDMVVEQN
jgi:hypothetical protein